MPPLMRPDVNSEVPKVQINEKGYIELTVQIVGIPAGKYVDVWGYIAQPGGGITEFKQERAEIPKPDPKTKASKLTVTLLDETAEELGLNPDADVTVLTWVSYAWPSMLVRDRAAANGTKAWKIRKP